MTADERPPVTYAVAGPVATLTMDRPDERNVLNAQSLVAMREGLRLAAADDAVRVVVLTGAGGTFCAGADLRAADADASAFAESGPTLLVGVLEALLDHPKATVARVQGHVAGGGNGLVAACDLAVAIADATFAFSEVRVGVAPAVVSVACLRVMPAREAAELMLTGARVTADRARQAGLLTAVVGADRLDSVVREWVDQLARGGPAAVAATRELLRRVPAMERAAAFAWAAELSAALFSGPEAAEGMAAFRERRPAAWVPPADTG